MSTYFWILTFSVLFPFLLSFDKKVAFFRFWKFFFPANSLVAVLFISWDFLFTHMEVWGFNPVHLSGLYLLNIPLEEALFFIVIPYCSVFTYEVLNTYLTKDYLSDYSRWISTILVVIILPVGLYFLPRLYTSVNLILSGILIILFQFVFRFPFMGRFYLAFAVIQIPFIIVNGLLTGTGISEEVVWYNPHHNLGIRILTIPAEDVFYGLNLILLNIGFYELLKRKSIK